MAIVEKNERRKGGERSRKKRKKLRVRVGVGGVGVIRGV